MLDEKWEKNIWDEDDERRSTLSKTKKKNRKIKNKTKRRPRVSTVEQRGKGVGRGDRGSLYWRKKWTKKLGTGKGETGLMKGKRGEKERTLWEHSLTERGKKKASAKEWGAKKGAEIRREGWHV